MFAETELNLGRETCGSLNDSQSILRLKWRHHLDITAKSCSISHSLDTPMKRDIFDKMVHLFQ